MRVPIITPIKPQPTFGIYKVTSDTYLGRKDSGILKGQELEIYTGKDTENSAIKHKLYYLKDLAGNFIKSKLVIFENGKKKCTTWCIKK